MLTYSITDTKGLSLYEYIYQCIRDDIVDGKLAANEKLPSKRAFAKNHGISTVTVENAYGQLMAEGYIYSMPKKGFFVSAIEKQIKRLLFSQFHMRCQKKLHQMNSLISYQAGLPLRAFHSPHGLK